MSVTAMVGTGPEQQALVVPKDAVLIRPDGSTVWVALPEADGDQFQVQPVPVTIGARTADQYAVESETPQGRELLVPGAKVVIEGAERLMPGQQVRIVTLPTASNQHGKDRFAGGQRPPRVETTP